MISPNSLKKKPSSNLRVRPCSSDSLFNMLQDQRHSVIVDLRPLPEFLNCFIAKSYCHHSQPEGFKIINLQKFIEQCGKNAREREKKDKSKEIRRFVFVGGEVSEIGEIVDGLTREGSDFERSRFYEFQDLEGFAREYGFVCLSVEAEDLREMRGAKTGNFKKKKNRPEEGGGQVDKQEEVFETAKSPLNLDTSEANKDSDKTSQLASLKLEISKFPEERVDFEQLQQMLLRKKSRRVLLANSEFPVKVSKDNIFFGKRTAMNSSTHMAALQISKCVEFYFNEKKNNITEKATKSHFETLKIYLNSNKLVDFDYLCEQIRDFKGSDRLLYVQDNLKTAECLLLAYLMIYEKKNLNMASLKVFSVLGTTECDKICYNQLMNYRPGQIRRYS